MTIYFPIESDLIKYLYNHTEIKKIEYSNTREKTITFVAQHFADKEFSTKDIPLQIKHIMRMPIKAPINMRLNDVALGLEKQNPALIDALTIALLGFKL